MAGAVAVLAGAAGGEFLVTAQGVGWDCVKEVLQVVEGDTGVLNAAFPGILGVNHGGEGQDHDHHKGQNFFHLFMR